jgi:hypothetical protein
MNVGHLAQATGPLAEHDELVEPQPGVRALETANLRHSKKFRLELKRVVLL